MDQQLYNAAFDLIGEGGNLYARNALAATLRLFGVGPLRFARERGISVVALERDDTYASVSPALARLGVDVDAWPAPPAGLFVVEERRVYVRSRSPMTVAHEFGHALDCALGGGVYRSGFDPAIRSLFIGARSFVTPYAATAIDEYFAECIRAYVGANDPLCTWPRVSRAKLRRTDPAMFAYIDELFQSEFALAA